MRYPKALREEAIRRMIRSEEILEQMKPISMHALTKRYKVCWKILTKLERGEHVTPKYMTQEDLERAVRDLRRYRKLESMHETREEIAKDLGIEKYRSLFYSWMKDKFKAGGVDRYSENPVERFLKMKLSQNPGSCAGYY